MAVDLASSFDVTVYDPNPAACDGLPDAVQTVSQHDAKIPELVGPHDIIVGAVPGHLGFETARQVIDAGKDLVDISFFPEEARELSALAEEKGVVAAVDCGVAPGLWNMVLGHAEETFVRVDRATCYVGGLPQQREWPYEYKAPFSPIDVIEEYTRPARYLQEGAVFVKEALTDAHFVEFDGVGKLEAFNTDGLRTLLKGMKTPSIREYTMRYPGHIELMRVFRDLGLFSKEPIGLDQDGNSLSPLDLTSELLFEKWAFAEGEADVTVMRIVLQVWKTEDEAATLRFDLHDVRDRHGVMSMARTTGYTATGVVGALAAGKIPKAGLYAPEDLGRIEGCYEHVLKHLEDRDVKFTVTEEGFPGDQPEIS